MTTEEILKSNASFEFEEWKKDHPDQLRILLRAMNQLSDLRLKEYKTNLLSRITIAIGGTSNMGMSSRSILEDIVIKSLKE